jgi:hypothetical protein
MEEGVVVNLGISANAGLGNAKDGFIKVRPSLAKLTDF